MSPTNPDGHNAADLSLMDQAHAQAMRGADELAETASRLLARRGEVQGVADLMAFLRAEFFEPAPHYAISIAAAALMELGKVRWPVEAVSDAG